MLEPTAERDVGIERAQARPTLWVLLAGVCVGALLTGCGSGETTAPPPDFQPTSAPPPLQSTAPAAPIGTPTSIPTRSGSPVDLDEYRRRCLARTATLDQAYLFYDRITTLVVGESTTFSVRIDSSSQGTAGGLPRQGGIQLACTVQARLIASPDLAATPQEWSDQKYLPPAPTSWEWVLTPTVAGTFTGVVQLKPVIQNDDGATTSELRTESFQITFRVAEPPTSLASKGGEVASGLWKGIVGFAGGVTVLLGAAVGVVTLLKKRKKPAGSPEESAEVPEPPQSTRDEDIPRGS